MEKFKNIETLLKWNRAYREGKPLATDYDYDFLFDYIQTKFPEKFREVRPLLMEEKGDFKLPIVMGSLDKIKADDNEALDSWFNKQGSDEFIITSKVDGMSILLAYFDSKLVGCYTRGDGYYGKEQTEKLYNSIPRELPDEFTGLTLIRGEAVLTREAFNAINVFAKKPYKNPRNAVVGIVGADDLEEECRYISFIGFQIFKAKPMPRDYEDVILKLSELGFKTPKYIKLNSLDSDNLMSIYNEFKEDSQYDIDGIVIQNNLKWGECSTYLPKFAIAWKANQLAVESEIVGYKWVISKDGSLRPIAQVAPVELGGSTISQASAYNYDWIKTNKVGIGAKITLLKSGDIIPKIDSVLECSNVFNFPRVCDCCGSSVIERGKHLYCSNDNCTGATVKSVSHFLKNLGVEVASNKSLANWNINTLADLLEFRPDESKKQQVKFYNELLDKLFPISVEKLISSFDYSGVGKKIIAKIIEANSLETFIDCFFNLKYRELKTTSGITAETYQRIDKGIMSNNLIKYFRAIISDPRWLEYNDKRIAKKNEIKPLKNCSFCFTGSLSIGRNYAVELVENLGGTVKSSVVQNLTYLVTNNPNSTSGKNKKAKQLGTEIINEEQFFEKVNYVAEKGRQVEDDDIDFL